MRYIARKHGLYGSNDVEAAKIDIIFDGIIDFKGKQNGELEIFNKAMENYGPKFERIIRSNDQSGPFLLGKQISFSDIILADVLLLYASERGASLTNYPYCEKLVEAFCAITEVADYLASEKRYPCK